MFRIVTIAREYGSGGAAIAREVARQLGWELLDREMIEAVARAAQVDEDTVRRYDECVDSWIHRLHRGGLRHVALEGGASREDAIFFDAEMMAAFARDVIARAGARGQCVVVGRGGQCVLQRCAEAFHVFVYAPWTERIARLGRRLPGVDLPAAIRATDMTRAAYIRRYFGFDWKDPHLYHMMISSQLGEAAVARLIIQEIQRSESTDSHSQSTHAAGQRG